MCIRDSLGGVQPVAEMLNVMDKNTEQSIMSRLEEKDPLLACLLYTSPSPRDRTRSRMPSSA